MTEETKREMKTYTVSMRPKTWTRVEKEAAIRQWSRSMVVREALAFWLEHKAITRDEAYVA